MDLWNLKSAIYRAGRSLLFVRLILDGEIRNIRALMQECESRPDRMLDIGTGVGSTLGIFPEEGFLVCLDRSIGMAGQIRKISRRHAEVVRGDALSLPIRNGSFSFVSAIGLSEYIQEKGNFLDEIRRVLAPQGYFLATLSPPGILNALRFLFGAQIHLTGEEIWEDLASSKGFAVVGKRKSLIQTQYLFRVERL